MERGIYFTSKIKHASKWLALREQGIPVVSTWIDEDIKDDNMFSSLWSRCVYEAARSCALICYIEDGEVLKGGLVEIGAALGAEVPVFVVGNPQPGWTFVHHPRVTVVDTIEEAVKHASLSLKIAKLSEDTIPNFDPPKFHGQCMGVDVESRGANDQHIMIVACVEDDENWHRKYTISSSWLSELIKTLHAAQAWCTTQTPDISNGRQYGWKFNYQGEVSEHGCSKCGRTTNDDESAVQWKCQICKNVVCRDHTLMIPGRIPREYFHQTLCSMACWEIAGRPEE